MNSWIDGRACQSERTHLTILFDKYVSRCLEHIRSAVRTVVPVTDISMVQVHSPPIMHRSALHTHVPDHSEMCVFSLTDVVHVVGVAARSRERSL